MYKIDRRGAAEGGGGRGPLSAKCDQNHLGNDIGLQIHPNKGFRG